MELILMVQTISLTNFTVGYVTYNLRLHCTVVPQIYLRFYALLINENPLHLEGVIKTIDHFINYRHHNCNYQFLHKIFMLQQCGT